MPNPDPVSFLIVSDFHMAMGKREIDPVYDPLEDFFYDAAFERFLDHFMNDEHPPAGSCWDLVILGDLIEFMQVQTNGRPYESTTESDAAAKLHRVAEGHRAVFDALAKWIANGHRLHVVPGNHDIELAWPRVQEQFRSEIMNTGSMLGIRPEMLDQQLRFWGWIFYYPGVVYAEHGQQYDRLNSFLTPLWPFIPEYQQLDATPRDCKVLPFQQPLRPLLSDAPAEIDVPFGSTFVHFVFNRVEHDDPFSDNVKPIGAYIGWALRRRRFRGIGYVLSFFLHEVWGMIRHVPNVPDAERTIFRANYRSTYFPLYRTHLATYTAPPLPLDALEDIDELAHLRQESSKQGQLVGLLARSITTRITGAFAWLFGFLAGVNLLIVLVTSTLKRLSGQRDQARPRRIVLLAMLLTSWGVSFGVDKLRQSRRTPQYNALYETAEDIHAILERTGCSVPVYVFGHTHTLETEWLQPSSEGSRRPSDPRYINSGTWTPVIPDWTDLLRERETFPFVQISTVGDRDDVESALLLWNDQAGRVDPVQIQRPRLLTGDASPIDAWFAR